MLASLKALGLFSFLCVCVLSVHDVVFSFSSALTLFIWYRNPLSLRMRDEVLCTFLFFFLSSLAVSRASLLLFCFFYSGAVLKKERMPKSGG